MTIVIIFASKKGSGDDPGPPGPGPTPPLGPSYNPYGVIDGSLKNDKKVISGILQADLSSYENMSQE